MENLLTIQQVAQATGLSEHTLRYYERIGLIHSVHRLENSHRRYTEQDIGWINFLTKLRKTGMSIQQMCAYAELQRQGDASLAERIQMLREHREKVEQGIAELQENLAVIHYKIDYYQGELDNQEREPQV